MKLLIKQGKIVSHRARRTETADILVDQERIVRIGKKIAARDVQQVIDAQGLPVFPGFVDMHTHLREPGYEYKETIQSGCRAAAAGGFTSVCCMPNTNPPLDNQAAVEFVVRRARECGGVNVFPIGAITRGRLGKELSEIGDLKKSGVVGLSDDGSAVVNAELLRRAMEYASMFDLPILCHCEDPDLAAGGVMHEGKISTVLGLKGIPSIAESIIVARDIALAAYTGARVHICHVSCADSVDRIRRAKRQGVAVTAECCPHHFTLTDEAVSGYDTATKVNPPLRTRQDVEAIKKGLRDGTIDCIATDHAPHAAVEKDAEYANAPFGIIGLETAFALVISELVNQDVLTLAQVVEKMAWRPSEILRLGRGSISEGAPADLTIVDPLQEWTIGREHLFSKSANTPFIGRKVRGKVLYTVANGMPVFAAAAG
ncbi:MAG: dihydroorotase [Candidatus Omnitrophica bacterium]|nr:dihydroorotase [Candidatus Omnitrophota bacterium]